MIEHLSPYERRHPLLPEYLLTEKGKLYREAAKTVYQAEMDMGAGRLSAKAWNIPVLLALEFEYERFQEDLFSMKLPQAFEIWAVWLGIGVPTVEF